jgi:hypothetical protein
MEKRASSLLRLLFSVVAFSTLSFAEQVTVPAQDVSSPGNPLAISGSAQISETTSERQVRVSISNDITARNISPKGILALVAWVEVSPAHASMQRFTKELDCFFGPDIIKPGGQESFSAPLRSASTEPYNANSPPRTPQANVRIVYVQFTDGSTFGDEAFAQHLRDLRHITLQNLRRLDRAYARGGVAVFVEELNETVSPAEVNNFLESIRRTQREFGAQAALTRVRAGLQFAEEHKAGLRLNSP